MNVCRFARRRERLLGFALLIFLFSIGAFASETDNFYLPLEPGFADLGDFLEAIHTRAVEEGVREINSRIEAAIKLKDSALRARQIAQWQRPEALAEAVSSRFGDAPPENHRIESSLRG